MQTRLRYAFAAFLMLGLRPAYVSAQDSVVRGTSWAVGASLGATVPLGDFANDVKLGLHAGGLVDWQSPRLMIPLRFEVQFHQHDAKDYSDVTWRTLSVGAGLKVPLGGGANAMYLITGPAMYNLKASISAAGTTFSADENRIGFNVGLGTAVPIGTLRGFMEARFHYISTSGSSVQFIPLSLGVLF